MNNQEKIKKILAKFCYQTNLEQIHSVEEYQNEAITEINKIIMECLSKEKDDFKKIGWIDKCQR